uniref:Uncharacterized protein n=1 Tax=Oryza brachyantha TaxID=4533 RepID=J3KX95_ORYBR
MFVSLVTETLLFFFFDWDPQFHGGFFRRNPVAGNWKDAEEEEEEEEKDDAGAPPEFGGRYAQSSAIVPRSAHADRRSVQEDDATGVSSNKNAVHCHVIAPLLGTYSYMLPDLAGRPS